VRAQRAEKGSRARSRRPPRAAGTGGSDSVSFFLTNGTAQNTTTVRCDVPASSGSWPISASLLQRIPAGTGAGGFATQARFTATTASSEIDFYAAANGVSPGGDDLSLLSVTFD
jgi:hypothetical protein